MKVTDGGIPLCVQAFQTAGPGRKPIEFSGIKPCSRCKVRLLAGPATTCSLSEASRRLPTLAVEVNMVLVFYCCRLHLWTYR